VLVNFTNNAIKFTAQGEINIRARIVNQPADAIQLRFEVQDTGIGIAQNKMSNLFQTFQQGDSSISRKYGGSGLGLAISKRLAILMGGEVGVESEQGRGSTFWFTLRCSRGNKPDTPVQMDEHVQAALTAIQGARILLVEDSLFNQQVAREFLQDAGGIVTVASNGREALDLLQLHDFDCVLMDMQMPIMDGIEATRRIRADKSLGNIPVIAMTANVTAEDRARCHAAGMDGFISKPFKFNELYITLASRLTADSALQKVMLTPAVEPESSGDPNVIDLSILEEMMSGYPERIAGFAQRFVISTLADIDEIEKALEQKDMASLEALGHRAKSPAKMVGAGGFAELCKALEKTARAGDIEKSREVVVQMRPLLQQISQRIEML
jgi:CheY-like chemotaxis protein